MIPFELQRRQMVSDQLVARGIRDPKLLAVMGEIPRHGFVPIEHRAESYTDHPVPIGSGQTISQPYMVALMTEQLRLNPTARVLEVGGGSGYQAAVLSRLAASVYSMERIPELAQGASEVLRQLKISNVEIRVGDGSLGWPEAAPFDGILVTAAGSQVPPALVEQLAEGGRLVMPVGSLLDQTLTVVERRGGKEEVRSVCGCVFVPLIGKQGYQEGEASAHDPTTD